MSPAEVPKYDYIDALRGLAVLGVVSVHTTQLVRPASAGLQTLASAGGSGVQLFYLASALTLFLSLDTRKSTERNSTLKFFIRRYFRIAPPVLRQRIGLWLLLWTGPPALGADWH
jgi:peptidoglycan/LPS O-acetylase OafA/YrhL